MEGLGKMIRISFKSCAYRNLIFTFKDKRFRFLSYIYRNLICCWFNIVRKVTFGSLFDVFFGSLFQI